MSVPLEHEYYIGLTESLPSMESSSRSSCATGLNLKATELRLGLPGSESPERDGSSLEEKSRLSLGMLKNLVSGAKRGFYDAINGASEKWVVSGVGGSDVDLGKGGNLFSPRAFNAGNKVLNLSEVNNQPTVKVGLPQSPKLLHENKPQVSPPASK